MYKPFALTLAALACVVSLYTLAKAQEANKPQDAAELSLSHANQLSKATLMYAMDYDDIFPYGKTMAENKPLIQPYLKFLKAEEAFVDPTSGKDFVYNPALSKMPKPWIKDPLKSVMFYSPSAHTDGQFTVAYVDGHCKREMAVPSLTIEKNLKRGRKAFIAPPTAAKPVKRKR